MSDKNSKPKKTLFSGGVVGRDVVTVVRSNADGVEVAAWRIAKRPPAVGPTSTPRPADPNDVQPLSTPPSVDVERVAYERGFHEGQAAAASSAESMVERYDGAIAQLSKALEQTEAAATRDSVRLALRIAEKLVRKAMAEDPEALALAVASAVEHTDGNDALTVTCDGKTARGLKMQIDELVSSLGLAQIDVTEDPQLATGDLMLSRGSSTLDARIQTRVGRIEQALLRELGIENTIEAKS